VSARRPGPIVAVAAAVAALFCAIPLAALVARAPWSEVGSALASREFAQALGLSAVVSLGATAAALALAAPVAWLLARFDFAGRGALRTLVSLPLVLPPVVGGVALLAAFGRRGLLGGALAAFGIELPFTTAAAILAATFVAAPLVVTTLEAAFAETDRRLEDVAASLGAGPLRILASVVVPQVRPSLVAALALAWARALGEFGATITFAGNLPGRTQTLTLAIYETLQSDPDRAFLLACVLLALSATAVGAGHRRVLR
jgi:molybdate transport system permease protein